MSRHFKHLVLDGAALSLAKVLVKQRTVNETVVPDLAPGRLFFPGIRVECGPQRRTADFTLTERVRDLVSRTRLEVYIVSSAQDAIRQMLVHTFDVIALHTAVEGAVPLCTFLLDLRHARNTLLLLYPVPTAEARAHYYRRGFDLCLPEDDPAECAAGIEALFRHPWAGAWDADQRPPALVVHGDLVIDPLRRRVTMRGRDIDLTPAEYRLLYFLASNPGIVFSKDYLYARVWGEDRAYGAGSVVNFICSLRKKLGLTARDPDYIRTVSHAGYCFGK